MQTIIETEQQKREQFTQENLQLIYRYVYSHVRNQEEAEHDTFMPRQRDDQAHVYHAYRYFWAGLPRRMSGARPRHEHVGEPDRAIYCKRKIERGEVIYLYSIILLIFLFTTIIRSSQYEEE